MNNLAYTFQEFNRVDNYVIERLFHNLFNNSQPNWIKESLKILAEVFQKPNVKDYNTNVTAINQYLGHLESFVN